MKLGIVGLPNVGKSTLFNAITRAGAQAANYPFCTIEPNTGVVPVPDKRLDELARMYQPKKVTPATVEFVDIAGLVKGASRGEGIGRLLVEDCLRQAAACGFRGLQFNAVVASNKRARALYESLGFARIGMIPGGFCNKDDVYEDMYIYYHPTE